MTLNITGGVATSVAVGTQASHGTATASGTTITYTPTASYSGSDSFTYTATNGGGTSAPATVSITVSNATVTYSPSSPAGGAVGSAYSQSIAGASGATAPYAYTVASGALPAGLTLASNGTISGTPTAGGSFNFTVTTTDSSTGTGPFSATSGALTLVIAPPTIAISPASLSNPAFGSAYSASITGSGGTSSYSFALTAGSLPAGLALASNGTLAGTPTASGTFNFTVTATDSSTGTGPYTGSHSFTLTVSAPTITLAPASLTAVTVGSSTNQTITASGGIGPYSYAVTAGSLPAGLSLTSGGVLSGTPTAGGSFSFTVTATDSSGSPGPYTGSRAYTLTVNAPTIAIAPPALSAIAAGATVSGTLTASGGTSTYSYAVTAGSLPPGVALSSTGALSGAATGTGTYNFTVTATDSSSGSGPYNGNRAYSWTINAPALTISPVSGSNLSGSALSGYSQAFTPSGGTAPYTYGIVINSGSMPAGLSFSTSNGILSGTPTAGGTVNFTVTATDATTGAGSPFQVSGTYNLTIGAPTVVVAPAGSVANPVIGTAYSQTFTASGATAPYAYVISAGALPPGLTLSAAGALTGTPTAAGSFNFTVQATDANNFAGTRAYSVTIAAPTIAVAPATLPNGSANAAYSQTLSSSGGTAPYSYLVTAGSLPAGLTLNGSTGAITGTPTAANTYNFTVTATDSTTGTGAPFTASKAYSVVISMQSPVAGTKTVSTPYNTPVLIDLAPVITGGTPASIAVATAPAHGSAVVAGLKVTYTPAAGYAGSDSFTYTATNAGGTSAVATVTVTVTAPTLAVSPAGLPGGQVGVAYGQTVSASGGTAPYSYTVSTGTLPSGLSLDSSSGVIAGTPTATGTFNFTIRATDSTGGTAAAGSQAYAVTISPALPIAGAKSVTVAFNTATQIDLSGALSGGPAVTLAIAVQPGHGTVTLNGSTATYTPAADYTGADSFSYTAGNASGTSAAATVTIKVNPAPPVAQPVTVTVTNGNPAGGGGNATVIPLIISGGPAVSITIVTPPRHGTLNIVGLEARNSARAKALAAGRADTTADTPSVTYTPNPGYYGPDSFSYTASNAAGTSIAATVSISVDAPPPTLGVVSATTKSGQPVTLAVTTNAVGGPFTGLTIVTPPSHGKAVVQGMAIVYTSLATFAGTDTVVYSLSNAYGSTQGTATVTVAGRLDPSKDAEVNGLLSAQADATRRFASSQLNNFSRRLESLHADGWAKSNFGLSLSSFGGEPSAQVLADPLSPQNPNSMMRQGATTGVDAASSGKARGMAPRRGDSAGGNATARPQNAAGETGAAAAMEPTRSELSWWVGGSIDFGHRNMLTGEEHFRFHTDGVSLGADYRVSNLWSVGVGGGFSSDRSEVGSKGSKSSSNSSVLAVYASLRPAPNTFVDGVLGYSALSFDVDRFITDEGGFATGHRRGRQWFGSLASGYEYRERQGLLLSAYARLDLMRATLNGYTESAADVSSLTYGDQVVRMTTGRLGLRAESAYALSTGELQPRARIEYQHHFEGADLATMGYTDLGSAAPIYTVRPLGARRSQWMAEVGGKWVLRSGFALSLDYGSSLATGGGAIHTIRLGAEGRF